MNINNTLLLRLFLQFLTALSSQADSKASTNKKDYGIIAYD